jgi:hypothetical protein
MPDGVIYTGLRQMTGDDCVRRGARGRGRHRLRRFFLGAQHALSAAYEMLREGWTMLRWLAVSSEADIAALKQSGTLKFFFRALPLWTSLIFSERYPAAWHLHSGLRLFGFHSRVQPNPR